MAINSKHGRTGAIHRWGVVAGCYVSDGYFSREGVVSCLRDSESVGRGKIISLQRERKVVKEVHAGHECGFVCADFRDWQEGDIVHCFLRVEQASSE